MNSANKKNLGDKEGFTLVTRRKRTGGFKPIVTSGTANSGSQERRGSLEKADASVNANVEHIEVVRDNEEVGMMDGKVVMPEDNASKSATNDVVGDQDQRDTPEEHIGTYEEVVCTSAYKMKKAADSTPENEVGIVGNVQFVE
ncbi:hypothetical protein L6452_21080 [Arctium lappa]|uniref:Uncharacterized protein n=1 Tax=Arctium lappa TaxID=4217 RepID=A0ACB9BCN8_ARCLA|nr:hypothetical protein L6452_21080 [Arctium lappa]